MPVVLPPARFDNATDGLLTGVAQGDVLYRGASAWNNLPAGTAGFVLTTNGPGANPSWAAAGGGSLTGAVILAPAAVNRNLVQPTADTNKGLVIRGFSPTQSANLQEWQLSTGANAALVDPTGTFSCPGAGASSERFGAGSAAAGGQSVAIGAGASAANAETVAIGWFAAATANDALAIGRNTTASGTNAIAIGSNTSAAAASALSIGGTATQSGAVAVGSGSQATGSGTTVVGQAATASGASSTVLGNGSMGTNTAATALGMATAANGAGSIVVGSASSTNIGDQASIVFGRQSTSTAAAQVVFGDNTSGWYVRDLYLCGVVGTNPQATSVNANGGSGANIAGGNLAVAGGKSTGSAKGGDVLIQTAPAGIAGSGLNPLATLAQFTGDSKIGLFGVTPVARQTGGAATAGATYTAAEQGMINRMYAALQAYGWLT